MATKLKNFSTTPGSNNAAAPDGWPEGMLPSAVNNTAREDRARLAEWYQDAEWLLRADAVTAFTGTTLTITGDVTAKYTKNRAIRLDESNSKIARVVSSTYGAPSTTVTVAGYTIVALPTAVEVGIVDSSAPESARQDVASAATTVLDGTSKYVRITDTTTITAFTLADGQWRDVVFGGALTLTNGASLILPGGANITTAAGDTMRVIGEAAGVVRVQDYQRAAASPVVSSAGRLTATRYYTSSDTWTKPANLDFVLVEVVGGGGGGGGGDVSGAGNAGAGAGGGGGGYSKKKVAASALGATEAVTVGAAGSAGVAGPNAGGAGGNSSFGTHATANGGAGGASMVASTTVARSAGGAGGTAASGDVNISGQNGFDGTRFSSTQAGGGGGGFPIGGLGAGAGGVWQGTGASTAGRAATGYGGGGGGGASVDGGTDVAGGAGTAGIVVVYEYSL